MSDAHSRRAVALVALSLACSMHPASANDEAARKLLDGLWTGTFYEASEESLDLVLAMPAEAQQAAAWLVQFYTPWCARCRRFEAEWGALAASTDQRGPDSRVRLARLDASDSTAAIKRFKLKGFPEFLLFNGSSYHRLRGEPSLPRLQAFVSGGGGTSTPEAVRAPSAKFALNQLGDEAADEEQQLTQLGLSIAGGVFLLGLFIGCFCSLRRSVCLLTCGLCCRGQRDDGRRARRNLTKPKRE